MWGVTVNGSPHFSKMTKTIILISYASHILHCDLDVSPSSLCPLPLEPGWPFLWVAWPTGFSRNDAMCLLRLDYKNAKHLPLALLESIHHTLREPELPHTERPPGDVAKGVSSLTAPLSCHDDPQYHRAFAHALCASYAVLPPLSSRWYSVILHILSLRTLLLRSPPWVL